MDLSRAIVIIQARMRSERFPGKSLYVFNGESCLSHLVSSVTQLFPREQTWLATSVHKEDDAIEAECVQLGLNLFRGDEYDVASRFVEIIGRTEASHIVRLSGDSPLLDYRIIERVVNAGSMTDFDLVTTVSELPYPSGMHVELLKSSTFLESVPQFQSTADREHVTKYYYEHSEQYHLSPLLCDIEKARSYKFSFDTREDCARLEKLFSRLKGPHYNYTLAMKCGIYRSVCMDEESKG